jgi:hypothetical protein
VRRIMTDSAHAVLRQADPSGDQSGTPLVEPRLLMSDRTRRGCSPS